MKRGSAEHEDVPLSQGRSSKSEEAAMKNNYVYGNAARKTECGTYGSPVKTAVKTWADGSSIGYGRGKFDDKCIFLTDADGRVHAPLDREYFLEMRRLADRFGTEKVYADFVRIYDLTWNEVSEEVLRIIDETAKTYGEEFFIPTSILFTTLYLGMIAENCKERTRLGKRIKRLGVHVLLIGNVDYRIAANFMRGMSARDLAALCVQYGF